MATPKKVKLLATLKAGAETYAEGKVYEGENIPEEVLTEVEEGSLAVRVLEWEQEKAVKVEPPKKEEPPFEEEPTEEKAEEKEKPKRVSVSKTSTSNKK